MVGVQLQLSLLVNTELKYFLLIILMPGDHPFKLVEKFVPGLSHSPGKNSLGGCRHFHLLCASDMSVIEGCEEKWSAKPSDGIDEALFLLECCLEHLSGKDPQGWHDTYTVIFVCLYCYLHRIMRWAAIFSLNFSVYLNLCRDPITGSVSLWHSKKKKIPGHPLTCADYGTSMIKPLASTFPWTVPCHPWLLSCENLSVGDTKDW